MKRRDFLKGTAGVSLAAMSAAAMSVAKRAEAQSMPDSIALTADAVMAAAMPDLPADFLWGASTSAYQIEGSDDRGQRLFIDADGSQGTGAIETGDEID